MNLHKELVLNVHCRMGVDMNKDFDFLFWSIFVSLNSIVSLSLSIGCIANILKNTKIVQN